MDGTRSWTQMLGVAGADTIPQGTRMDASGNVYLSGYTQGNLDGNTLVGSANLFVSKYNTNGTKQWTKLRGNASTFGNAIAVDGSANSYVTGYKNGSSLDSFSHPNGGNSLFRRDHKHKIQWHLAELMAH
ncbi:MAG: SBBP repeat-containing protein [Leptospiraceae bacterium]|nr:SBBP repeat-containing protein [Leptospiraceae bacterium]